MIIEDTIEQYERLLTLKSPEKREDFFRYSMMRPLKEMWGMLQVPLKASIPGGYDVLMAAEMLGFLNIQNKELVQKGLNGLKDMDALAIASQTLRDCLDFAIRNDLKFESDAIIFGVYLADPNKLKYVDGYSGFGGIPGYVMACIYPNRSNVTRFPALIAHEFHHNLRFSYFEWNHGNVTLGEYLVIEGLAEAFAVELFGEDNLGPWVTGIDEEELAYSLYVMGDALETKGFAEVASYMFGDDYARKEGYHPVGLSPNAGYAVGYHVVREFMKETHVSIAEATLLDAKEIIERSGVF